MSTELTRKGVKTGAMFLYAYRNGVAEAIGQEQALAIHKDVNVAMGSAFGKQLKEQLGEGEMDAAAVGRIVADLCTDMMGATPEIVSESPTEVVFKQGPCAFYDATVELGMHPADIVTSCNQTSMAFMDAMVRELDPRLSYRSKSHRVNGEGHCYDVLARA